ncbi:hypothetical protein PFISCL1PPCAC_9020, partial [Pristionchus fissidentatus]
VSTICMLITMAQAEVEFSTFAIVSSLCAFCAGASVLCSFYLPVLICTLNLILVSFAVPQYVFSLRISGKNNHLIIIAVAAPLSLLCAAG